MHGNGWTGLICSECVAQWMCYNWRKERRKARTGKRERKTAGRRTREKAKREGTANERERERSTQYALKLTTVSSLELIQKSVSCCLLRPLLTTQILEALCSSSCTNIPRKGYEHFFPTPTTNYEQIVGKTGLFSLGKANSLREGKLWIQTRCTTLKIWPHGRGAG